MPPPLPPQPRRSVRGPLAVPPLASGPVLVVNPAAQQPAGAAPDSASPPRMTRVSRTCSLQPPLGRARPRCSSCSQVQQRVAANRRPLRERSPPRVDAGLFAPPLTGHFSVFDIIDRCRSLPECDLRKIQAVAQLGVARRAGLLKEFSVSKSPNEKIGVDVVADHMGLRVKSVIRGGAAWHAGIRDNHVGWRLVTVKGDPATTVEQLSNQGLKNADKVEITLFPPPTSAAAAPTAAQQRTAAYVADAAPVPLHRDPACWAESDDSEYFPAIAPPSSGSEQDGIGEVMPHILDYFSVDPADLVIDRSRQLGKGAFGVVYRANFQGTTVAVKTIDEAEQNSPRQLRSWRREVKIMAHLRHPSIITFLGASFHPDQLLIVTELCDRELRDLLRADTEQPRSWRDKLGWGEQICQGMAYLHHKGVYHCDLKTSNVFVVGDRLRVADFGLSIIHRHRGGSSQELSRELSRQDSFGFDTEARRRRGRRDPVTGIRRNTMLSNDGEADIPGTFAFIAPEIWAEEPYSGAADVYSFGVILIECAARQVPWVKMETGESPQTSWRIMTGRERPRLPEAFSTCIVPPPYRNLTHRCLEFLPADRPSFAELAALCRKHIGMAYAAEAAPWPAEDEEPMLSVSSPEPHPSCRRWQ